MSAPSAGSAHAQTADAGRPAPQVGVVAVQAEKVAFRSQVAGRVVASRTAEIRPQVSGLVMERVFREGGVVKAGDVLYRLDTQRFEATVAASEAAVKRAQAGLASAKAQFDRYSNLSDSRVVSRADSDNAEAAYLQAEADVAAAQADLRIARINLGNATIVAPIDGLIGTAAFDTGSLVTANQTEPLATIRQLDPIFVDFTESSGNLLRFRSQIRKAAGRPLANDGGRIAVALRFADGTPYDEPGRIDTAEQFVSQTTSSFTIRSHFANPDRQLLPGMYVLGTVELDLDRQAFLLPQRAVSRNAGGEATALFLKPDNTVEARVLEVSTDIGTKWLVTGGVTDGDRLIVDGLQKARPGQPATPVEVVVDANGLVRPADAGAAVSKAGAAATNLSTTGGTRAGGEAK